VDGPYPVSDLVDRFRRAKTSDESGLWLLANRADGSDRWVARRFWLYQQYDRQVPSSGEFNAQPWNHLVRLYRRRGEHANANGILAHQRAVESDLVARALSQWLHLGTGLALAVGLVFTALYKAWPMLGILCIAVGVCFLPVLLVFPRRKGELAIRTLSFVIVPLLAAAIALNTWPSLAAVAEGAWGHFTVVVFCTLLAVLTLAIMIPLLKIDIMSAGVFMLMATFVAVVFSLQIESFYIYDLLPNFIIDRFGIDNERQDYVHQVFDWACLILGVTALLMCAARPAVHALDLLFWVGFRYALSPARAMATIIVMLTLGTVAIEHALDARYFVVDGVYAATAIDDQDQIVFTTGSGIHDAPSCEGFVTAPLFAADLFIPLIDLRQEFRCQIRPGIDNQGLVSTDSLTILKGVYQLLGWIVVSLAVITFVGAVRRTLEERLEL